MIINIIVAIIILSLISSILEKIFGSTEDGIGAILIIGVLIWGAAKLIGILSKIIAPILCLGIMICLIVIYSRRKRQKHLEYLALFGICDLKDINAGENTWNILEAKGFVKRLASKNVISMQFYNKVLQEINQCSVMSERELQDIFLQSAPKYEAIYNDVLLAALQEGHHLLKFSGEDKNTRYLSGKFVTKCEHLLNMEGATTKEEFSNLCSNSDITSCLHSESYQLANVIIENMVSTSKVDVCTLDSGNKLYISKSKDFPSKMTRVEISL